MVLSNLLRTFSAECRFYFDDEVRNQIFELIRGAKELALPRVALQQAPPATARTPDRSHRTRGASLGCSIAMRRINARKSRT